MFSKNKRGFTLVEALIVVVIIGVIAAVAIPKFLDARESADASVCRSNLGTINTMISEWEVAHPGQTLNDLGTILNDTNKFPDGPPTCPTDGSEYELGADGRAHCPHETDLGHKIVQD